MASRILQRLAKQRQVIQARRPTTSKSAVGKAHITKTTPLKTLTIIPSQIQNIKSQDELDLEKNISKINQQESNLRNQLDELNNYIKELESQNYNQKDIDSQRREYTLLAKEYDKIRVKKDIYEDSRTNTEAEIRLSNYQGAIRHQEIQEVNRAHNEQVIKNLKEKGFSVEEGKKGLIIHDPLGNRIYTKENLKDSPFSSTTPIERLRNQSLPENFRHYPVEFIDTTPIERFRGQNLPSDIRYETQSTPPQQEIINFEKPLKTIDTFYTYGTNYLQNRSTPRYMVGNNQSLETGDSHFDNLTSGFKEITPEKLKIVQDTKQHRAQFWKDIGLAGKKNSPFELDSKGHIKGWNWENVYKTGKDVAKFIRFGRNEDLPSVSEAEKYAFKIYTTVPSKGIRFVNIVNEMRNRDLLSWTDRAMNKSDIFLLEKAVGRKLTPIEIEDKRIYPREGDKIKKSIYYPALLKQIAVDQWVRLIRDDPLVFTSLKNTFQKVLGLKPFQSRIATSLATRSVDSFQARQTYKWAIDEGYSKEDATVMAIGEYINILSWQRGREDIRKGYNEALKNLEDKFGKGSPEVVEFKEAWRRGFKELKRNQKLPLKEQPSGGPQKPSYGKILKEQWALARERARRKRWIEEAYNTKDLERGADISPKLEPSLKKIFSDERKIKREQDQKKRIESGELKSSDLKDAVDISPKIEMNPKEIIAQRRALNRKKRIESGEPTARDIEHLPSGYPKIEYHPWKILKQQYELRKIEKAKRKEEKRIKRFETGEFNAKDLEKFHSLYPTLEGNWWIIRAQQKEIERQNRIESGELKSSDLKDAVDISPKIKMDPMTILKQQLDLRKKRKEQRKEEKRKKRWDTGELNRKDLENFRNLFPNVEMSIKKIIEEQKSIAKQKRIESGEFRASDLEKGKDLYPKMETSLRKIFRDEKKLHEEEARKERFRTGEYISKDLEGWRELDTINRVLWEARKEGKEKVWDTSDVKATFNIKKAQRIAEKVLRKYNAEIIGSGVIKPQTTLKEPPRGKGSEGDIDVQNIPFILGKGSKTGKAMKELHDKLQKAGFKVALKTSDFMGHLKWHITINGKEWINAGTSTDYFLKTQAGTLLDWWEIAKFRAWVQDAYGVKLGNIRDQLRVKLWKGYVEQTREKDVIDALGIKEGTDYLFKDKKKKKKTKKQRQEEKEKPVKTHIDKLVSKEIKPKTKEEKRLVDEYAKLKQYQRELRQRYKLQYYRKPKIQYYQGIKYTKKDYSSYGPYRNKYGKYTKTPYSPYSPYSPYRPYTPYTPPPPYQPPTYGPPKRPPRSESIKEISRKSDKRPLTAIQTVYVTEGGEEIEGRVFPTNEEAVAEGIEQVDNSKFNHFKTRRILATREMISRHTGTRSRHKFTQKRGLWSEKLRFRNDKGTESTFNVLPYVFTKSRF